MTKFLPVILTAMFLCALPAFAEEKAQVTAGQKAAEAGAPAGKAVAGGVEDAKPFVDRDGDGIRDGQEHRFRKRKHGQQEQEGEDDTGTGSGKRKRTMHGQTQSGGQGRQGR